MVKIPDGWLDYTKVHKPLQHLPIIAFKTPLSQKFHRPSKEAKGVYVEEGDQFTPSQLSEALEKKGYDLVVVIDLTFTFRYYSGVNELENDQGIKYVKVKCPGQVIPDDQIVQRVAKVFNKVIYEHGRDGKKLAGIHCTHGLNRTGYIVCRYLVEWHNVEPSEAIKMFNDARGHDIERENYISDIMARTPKKLYDEWEEKRKTVGESDEEKELNDQQQQQQQVEYRNKGNFKDRRERNQNVNNRPYEREGMKYQNYQRNNKQYNRQNHYKTEHHYHDNHCNNYSNSYRQNYYEYYEDQQYYRDEQPPNCGRRFRGNRRHRNDNSYYRSYGGHHQTWW